MRGTAFWVLALGAVLWEGVRGWYYGVYIKLANGADKTIGEGNSWTVHTRVDISYISFYYTSNCCNEDYNRITADWNGLFAAMPSNVLRSDVSQHDRMRVQKLLEPHVQQRMLICV